jgi:hypothetical protein
MTALLGDRLASLSPDRIKALVRTLGQEPGSAAAAPQRMPRNAEQRYPLSSAQERMWFLCQLSPESRGFNNPVALRALCVVPLERERLERSFNDVARRHEILRTTFHAENGRPVQKIHDSIALKVAWDDLREMPPEQREAEALRIAHAEGLQAFDLTAGPLITMRVLTLGELEYLLLITTHHLISDGWSNAFFSKELSTTYVALGQPGASALELPRFQYVDYVFWEQQWLQDDRFGEQLEYWKRRLTPELPPLPLPADRDRPPVMSLAGGMEVVRVPAALTARLRDFAREERVSLFQLLMAAWTALLYRCTGTDTISVGTSTANRDKREYQSVMGPFLNTLVIRTAVDGARSFRELLHDVRSLCQEALRNQTLPFEKLIGELNPRRTLNVHPIFQVMFVHQNIPALYEVPGIRLELLKIDYETSKFDLTLWAEEVHDDLLLTIFFSRDLFDDATVCRMLAYYQALLDSAVFSPDRAVERLASFPSLPTALSSAWPAFRRKQCLPPLRHRRRSASTSASRPWLHGFRSGWPWKAPASN